MVTAYFHDKTLTFAYVHDRIGQILLFSYFVHFLSFQVTLEKTNSGKNSHRDRNVHINHVTSKLSLSDDEFCITSTRFDIRIFRHDSKRSLMIN